MNSFLQPPGKLTPALPEALVLLEICWSKIPKSSGFCSNPEYNKLPALHVALESS